MSSDFTDPELPAHLREKQAEVRRQQTERDAAQARDAGRRGGPARMNLGWLRLWVLAGWVLVPLVPVLLILGKIPAPVSQEVSLVLVLSFALPLLFGFFFGMKSVFDFVTATYFTRRRTREATGLITGAELEKQPARRGWVYRPLIQFSFEAEGVTYEREFNPRDTWHNVEDWNNEILAQYPVGSTLTIKWDPAAPINSLPDLKARSRWFGKVLYFGSAIGLGCCIWLSYLRFAG